MSTPIRTQKLTPVRNGVFVSDLEHGFRKYRTSGLIIPDDNMKDTGIRTRWGKVWSIGPDVPDIKVGEWLLIQHGRWTLGIDVEADDGTITKVWKIDYPDAVMLICDECPLETNEYNYTGK
jgi:hypothetical protein